MPSTLIRSTRFVAASGPKAESVLVLVPVSVELLPPFFPPVDPSLVGVLRGASTLGDWSNVVVVELHAAVPRTPGVSP